MAEGCPPLGGLRDGQHIVEWAVETAEAYADCRDRVRLAADAWPKAKR